MSALSAQSERPSIDYRCKKNACLLIKLTINKQKWEKGLMLLISLAEKGINKALIRGLKIVPSSRLSNIFWTFFLKPDHQIVTGRFRLSLRANKNQKKKKKNFGPLNKLDDKENISKIMIAHKKAAETNVQKTERNTKHLPWKKEVARERERSRKTNVDRE